MGAGRTRLCGPTLGHVTASVPADPLVPVLPRRRHLKMPPEGAQEKLLESLTSARDRMAVTWLAHGGFRVAELCGLHLLDLHLRDDADCGECRSAHVHICHREANPNQARVKTKRPWAVEDGTVRGGQVRRASPAMIHSYFEYMTREYPADARHGMLFVQLHGQQRGQPWSTAAARGMLRRAGVRLELVHIRPHQWCKFASDVLDASGGNIVYARDAGGLASAVTVDQIYGHADVHDPRFALALNRVWQEA
jgi:integrase